MTTPDTQAPVPTIEELLELIGRGEMEAVSDILEQHHPADIADLLDEIDPADAVLLFRRLNVETASEVLDETGSLVRQELLVQLEDEHLAALLDELPMDDAAEFLDELRAGTATRLLALMEPEEAKDVQALLRYETETAGRLMTTEFAALRRQWTAAEAMEYLRSLTEAESLHYLYVVDRRQHLIGVVPLRNLVLARSETTVETIMSPDVVSVPVDADQEDLAIFISKYDYVAIPVVDAANRLVGVVTVDDALDVLAEEATEDIQRLGGSEPLANPYFTVTVAQMVQKRIVWLMLLFVASLFTSTVIRSFESILAAAVVLNAFIPLVTGTGGNAGSQTVTTVIRAIAVDEVRTSDLGRAWRREVSVGLILGLILGLVGAAVATLLGNDPQIGVVVGLTLPVVVIWSNTVATVVPIVAEHLQIDPTVISAPMITTIVDATALLVYFSTARLVLSL